jgi:hypothetical protein
MSRALLIALSACALSSAASGQVTRPPAGGVLDRFLAPPSGQEQAFLGSWSLTWDDPADRNCPCHGTLTIEVQQDGTLKGIWPMKGGAAILHGDVAFDQNLWAGRFTQPHDVDFPLKGHFRLEARGGNELTGSYQRDGTAIPYRWSAVRR